MKTWWSKRTTNQKITIILGVIVGIVIPIANSFFSKSGNTITTGNNSPAINNSPNSSVNYTNNIAEYVWTNKNTWEAIPKLGKSGYTRYYVTLFLEADEKILPNQLCLYIKSDVDIWAVGAQGNHTPLKKDISRNEATYCYDNLSPEENLTLVLNKNPNKINIEISSE